MTSRHPLFQSRLLSDGVPIKFVHYLSKCVTDSIKNSKSQK